MSTNSPPETQHCLTTGGRQVEILFFCVPRGGACMLCYFVLAPQLFSKPSLRRPWPWQCTLPFARACAAMVRLRSLHLCAPAQTRATARAMFIRPRLHPKAAASPTRAIRGLFTPPMHHCRRKNQCFRALFVRTNVVAKTNVFVRCSCGASVGAPLGDSCKPGRDFT